MPTFHFNHRDASFRHNLSQLASLDAVEGRLVTKSRTVIEFTHLLSGCQLCVLDAKCNVPIASIDHVAVETKGEQW